MRPVVPLAGRTMLEEDVVGGGEGSRAALVKR